MLLKIRYMRVCVCVPVLRFDSDSNVPLYLDVVWLSARRTVRSLLLVHRSTVPFPVHTGDTFYTVSEVIKKLESD